VEYPLKNSWSLEKQNIYLSQIIVDAVFIDNFSTSIIFS